MAAAINWTRVRIAARLLALADIAIFALTAWKTWEDKLRVAALMHQLGAAPWPYPAYHPDYPYGYVTLPDGGFALYNTTPDDLPVYLPMILFIAIMFSAGALVKRPGRLLALWPVILFTLITAPCIVSHANTVIELPDLLEASISPSTRIVTTSGGVATGLCQPTIKVVQGASAARSGPLYNVDLGTAYITSFPAQVTAMAFAITVAAKARQAGCAVPMQVVFKN